jgi:uncharacterized membrane protein YqjE
MSAMGVQPPGPSDPTDIARASKGFVSSTVRFFRLLTGLAGLELRESGWQALTLMMLGVGFVVACTFAYLFLMVGLTILLTSWIGGGLAVTSLILFVLHVALAVAIFWILRQRAVEPIFPATREALRREAEKWS